MKINFLLFEPGIRLVHDKPAKQYYFCFVTFNVFAKMTKIGTMASKRMTSKTSDHIGAANRTFSSLSRSSSISALALSTRVLIVLVIATSTNGFSIVTPNYNNNYRYNSRQRQNQQLQLHLKQSETLSIEPWNKNINHNNEDDNNDEEGKNDGLLLFRRDVFLRTLMVITTAAVTSTPSIPCNAFEGGVGGLGKTKPVTGVELFDDSMMPTQNEKNGEISVEIKGCSSDGKSIPILVSFQSPWPLLSSSGSLESRDIRSTESAFIQVIDTSSNNKKITSNNWKDDKKVFQQLLIDTVFNSEGKFGAYGTPYDVQVKNQKQNNVGSIDSNKNEDYQYYTVTFTTLTPAMRESERIAIIGAKQVLDGTMLLLVVTTLRTKFSDKPQIEKTFNDIVSSFQVIPAPETNLSRK